jgi:hypothetical protein
VLFESSRTDGLSYDRRDVVGADTTRPQAVGKSAADEAHQVTWCRIRKMCIDERREFLVRSAHASSSSSVLGKPRVVSPHARAVQPKDLASHTKAPLATRQLLYNSPCVGTKARG